MLEFNEYISELRNFLDSTPSKYLVVDAVAKRLLQSGFRELNLKCKFPELKEGDKVFVRKNGSSLFAFAIGRKPLSETGMKIVSAHSDFPCLQIKSNPEILAEGDLVKINIESYGGPILQTWFDRPLSIAGRMFVRGKDVYSPNQLLVNIERPLLLIPSLRFHESKGKDASSLSVQFDMMPVMGISNKSSYHSFLKNVLTEYSGIGASEILSYELCLYNTDRAELWGYDNEFLSSARLDDVSHVHAGLLALLGVEQNDATKVLAIWDNEECGSISKQGAASSIFRDVVTRVQMATEGNSAQVPEVFENSFNISLDCATAVHPNHPEKSDTTNRPIMCKGPTIKIDTRQRYATDAESEAVMKLLCQEENITYQYQMNHNDNQGGNTLASISAISSPIRSVDIGAPVWGMHSIKETTSTRDMYDLLKILSAHYDK